MGLLFDIVVGRGHFNERYGLPDSDEISSLIADMESILTPSGQARVEQELAKYPLSHMARVQRINLLLGLGDRAGAKNLVSVGLAIYPDSRILAKLFKRIYADDMTPEEAEAIDRRIAKTKTIPGFENI